jgi:hypothetical protein
VHRLAQHGRQHGKLELDVPINFTFADRNDIAQMTQRRERGVPDTISMRRRFPEIG